MCSLGEQEIVSQQLEFINNLNPSCETILFSNSAFKKQFCRIKNDESFFLFKQYKYCRHRMWSLYVLKTLVVESNPLIFKNMQFCILLHLLAASS